MAILFAGLEVSDLQGTVVFAGTEEIPCDFPN
jgi:hypothetical protein